jgi:O-acetylhomoserine (thiol)-lyase
MTQPGFTTANVHSDQNFGVEHGGIHKPIHTSVQYGYEKVEDLIGVFQGSVKGGYNYARQGTPTTAALEAKITQMEQGVGTICFGTGMAAITAMFLTLLKAGDHLISSQFVFGNTNSLLGTLQNFGIEVSLVDAAQVDAVTAAIKPNSRMVFVETIANPATQIPDLSGLGALCKAYGLLYTVDNTVTSPWIFRPRDVGAGLVINSLTKTIAGHGAALGGALTDTGLFEWEKYPNIFSNYRKGDPKGWGLQQIRKKGLRDMGGTLSSEQAHQISVGAETLALRSAQTSKTALELARYLEGHKAVKRVFYPLLESHPQHMFAKQHFSAGSWLLSFEVGNEAVCLEFLNRLKLPVLATGLGDTRTLIIPVAPTIFWEMGSTARAAMGITDGLIRLSVGLEDTADLIADFDQALASVG